MIKQIVTLALIMAGFAQAGCVIQQTQLTLPDYSALQDVAGSLDVVVRCDSALDEATLMLLAPGAQRSGADHLLLTLEPLTLPESSLSRSDTVQVTLVSAGPLLGGLRLTGSQTLRFTVRAARNQWVTTGFYALPLTFSLGQSLP
ncbi:hypothetical protein [Deinococcus navajonensis]|uniref:Lipoprotein n=1 Tax=Deinococcus navajonensis TaxID=309884 RepID=A0ABV8XHR5_9DEIO